MSSAAIRDLWDRWIELWNGRLELADSIIHPEFETHRIPPPRISPDLRGRDALVAWVEQTRTLFDDLHLAVEVGPVVDGDSVASRWVAEGTYRGGIPSSSPDVSAPIRFHGNDISRAEAGLIRKYWLCDDLLDLMQQLGVIG
jgi:predicted ester cyclase